MRFILIIIGTVLAVLFIAKIISGKKFESMVSGLDSGSFPMNQLYIVGLSWSQKGILKLKGKKAADLKMYAALLYEQQYADYYANIAWAEAITFAHLFLTISFLLAAIAFGSAALILLAGVFLSVLLVVFSLENMKNELSKRAAECEAQLPEVVSTMAILVNSGMILKEAWNTVANRGEGTFYNLMRRASENMKNGYTDVDAIFLFGKESNSSEIKKFTSALIQNLERGGAELSIFLMNQSSELWNAKRQLLLQKGEKASGKLLAPIAIIFIGIMIIVMTAAFAGPLF